MCRGGVVRIFSQMCQMKQGVILGCIFLFSSIYPCYGQSRIDCASIRNAVSQVPLTSSTYDWPLTLHIPGVVFPEWTKLDPKDAISMAETNYMLYSEIYYDRIKADNDTYMLHGKPAPGRADFGRIWARNQEPIYDGALSKGLLEYERVTLSGMFGETGNIVAFRYRIRDQDHAELQDTPTPGMAITSQYNSWEYVFRLYSMDGSYVDYPVGFDSNATQGEMATIGKSVVVFTTGPWGFERGLVEIVLRGYDPVVDPYPFDPTTKGETFSPIGASCNLIFGKK